MERKDLFNVKKKEPHAKNSTHSDISYPMPGEEGEPY